MIDLIGSKFHPKKVYRRADRKVIGRQRDIDRLEIISSEASRLVAKLMFIQPFTGFCNEYAAFAEQFKNLIGDRVV